MLEITDIDVGRSGNPGILSEVVLRSKHSFLMHCHMNNQVTFDLAKRLMRLLAKDASIDMSDRVNSLLADMNEELGLSVLLY